MFGVRTGRFEGDEEEALEGVVDKRADVDVDVDVAGCRCRVILLVAISTRRILVPCSKEAALVMHNDTTAIQRSEEDSCESLGSKRSVCVVLEVLLLTPSFSFFF